MVANQTKSELKEALSVRDHDPSHVVRRRHHKPPSRNTWIKPTSGPFSKRSGSRKCLSRRSRHASRVHTGRQGACGRAGAAFETPLLDRRRCEEHAAEPVTRRNRAWYRGGASGRRARGFAPLDTVGAAGCCRKKSRGEELSCVALWCSCGSGLWSSVCLDHRAATAHGRDVGYPDTGIDELGDCGGTGHLDSAMTLPQRRRLRDWRR